MDASPRAEHRLLGAMRELAAQSERVARAEARVVASRVTEVAQAGARRIALVVVAGALGTLATGFALLAAVDALRTVLPGWQAALIVSGGTLIAAALCAWGAIASPGMGTSVQLALHDAGDTR